MEKIGLQLYTVRDILADEKNIPSAMEKIKAMGYSEVQVYGDIPTAGKIAEGAKNAGLSVIGSTLNVKILTEEAEKVEEFHSLYGIKDIGIGYAYYKTKEEVFSFVEKANEFANRFIPKGFTLSYHNHSHEFIRFGDETAFDILLASLDERIRFVADTYWFQHAGCDVCEMLERLSGRVDIVHLKDMKRTFEGVTFAEVGYGNMAWKKIIATAEKCGAKHFAVEQDKCDGDPMESAAKSAGYLIKNFVGKER